MEEKRNHQLQAVCVAAGALAVLAATSPKQWRSWIFVILNILLLAILLTSKHGAYCSKGSIDDVFLKECDVDSKTERRRRKMAEEGGVKVSEKTDQVEEEDKIIECEVVSEMSTPMALSNEELNERVEAFIATFRRQYLVCSDVKGKSAPAKNARYILSKSISVV